MERFKVGMYRRGVAAPSPTLRSEASGAGRLRSGPWRDVAWRGAPWRGAAWRPLAPRYWVSPSTGHRADGTRRAAVTCPSTCCVTHGHHCRQRDTARHSTISRARNTRGPCADSVQRRGRGRGDGRGLGTRHDRITTPSMHVGNYLRNLTFKHTYTYNTVNIISVIFLNT